MSSYFVFVFGVLSAMLVLTHAYPVMEEEYLKQAEDYKPGYYVLYEVPEDNQEILLRPRRSLQPDAGVYDNGSLRTEISKDPQGNTNVGVGVQGNIYRNGDRRLDAEAQWSKVVRGPGRSKPQVGGSITYRW